MRFLLPFVLALGACATQDTDDAAADTDTTVTCDALPEGVWVMGGTCFGMTMTATLTLDDTGCAFTFSDWDMVMSVPAGGTVSADTVKFTGAGWKSCTGTFADGRITGGCNDGCAYEMALE